MSFRARVIDHAERCQFEQSPVERPSLLRWARAGVLWLRRVRYQRHCPVVPGAPSRFREGDWVRIKDRDDIQATLNLANKTRGLLFTDDQWSYCSGTYRVAKVVRRMLDDTWRMRSISGAVVLAGPSGLADFRGWKPFENFFEKWLLTSAFVLAGCSRLLARWCIT